MFPSKQIDKIDDAILLRVGGGGGSRALLALKLLVR